METFIKTAAAKIAQTLTDESNRKGKDGNIPDKKDEVVTKDKIFVCNQCLLHGDVFIIQGLSGGNYYFEILLYDKIFIISLIIKETKSITNWCIQVTSRVKI